MTTRRARRAADYIEKKLKAKTVAVIDDNEEYGMGSPTSSAAHLKADGVTVAVSDHIDKNAQDFSSTVNKIKPANVDAIFYGGYYRGRPVPQAAPRRRHQGSRGSPTTVPRTPADRQCRWRRAEGALMTCPCGDITTNPAAASFVAPTQPLNGSAPGTYSAEAFDAANVAAPGDRRGQDHRKDINDYLATVDYKGLAKTIKFDAKGEVAATTICVRGQGRQDRASTARSTS